MYMHVYGSLVQELCYAFTGNVYSTLSPTGGRGPGQEARRGPTEGAVVQPGATEGRSSPGPACPPVLLQLLAR
eukprot:357634-Chlamydomonas_euryale.AAC.4